MFFNVEDDGSTTNALHSILDVFEIVDLDS
jgi:hypothetical protein